MGACPSFDVCLEVLSKILERAQQRLHGSGGMQAESIAGGTDKTGVTVEKLHVARLATPFLKIDQQLLQPGNAFPTRRAEAAGFLCEKVLEID
jgi:hypothetical protein